MCRPSSWIHLIDVHSAALSEQTHSWPTAHFGPKRWCESAPSLECTHVQVSTRALRAWPHASTARI